MKLDHGKCNTFHIINSIIIFNAIWNETQAKIILRSNFILNWYYNALNICFKLWRYFFHLSSTFQIKKWKMITTSFRQEKIIILLQRLSKKVRSALLELNNTANKIWNNSWTMYSYLESHFYPLVDETISNDVFPELAPVYIWFPDPSLVRYRILP